MASRVGFFPPWWDVASLLCKEGVRFFSGPISALPIACPSSSPFPIQLACFPLPKTPYTLRAAPPSSNKLLPPVFPFLRLYPFSPLCGTSSLVGVRCSGAAFGPPLIPPQLSVTPSLVILIPFPQPYACTMRTHFSLTRRRSDPELPPPTE